MSEESTKRIVEVNGVKLEVDLRQAKRVDKFAIGDKVKLLVKEYSDSHQIYPAVIVGFENFEKLPTIIVAYFKGGYSETAVKFAYINAENKDNEIVPCTDDYLPIEKGETIRQFDRELEKKQAELDSLKQQKEYFLRRFGEYFKI